MDRLRITAQSRAYFDDTTYFTGEGSGCTRAVVPILGCEGTRIGSVASIITIWTGQLCHHDISAPVMQ